MKADMQLLNKEEDKLQREIKKMNQKNLHKHAEVLKKNKINANIQNTEHLVRRFLKIDEASKNQKVPLHKKQNSGKNVEQELANIDEDHLMQSIDNLDMLLANVQSKNADGKQ